jgi:hypothetical protein
MAVTTQPFFTNPLAYTVAVVNLNDGTVEADYTNWRLRSTKGQGLSSVNPDRVAAKLRKRAGWAALFAGMGAGMNSSYYSATVTGPNGTSTIQGTIPPDSREIAEARQRAAAPLQNAAAPQRDFVRRVFRDRRYSLRSGLLICSPPRSPLPLRRKGRRAAVTFTPEQIAYRYRCVHRVC